MKKRYKFLLLTAFTLFSGNYFSQTTIDVRESTIKISGNSEEVFYYGFAEGDKLIFNFECMDKTDKEIDQMVSELYGLTEEEIGIVENIS